MAENLPLEDLDIYVNGTGPIPEAEYIGQTDFNIFQYSGANNILSRKY
jgi:hypothetical protein